GWLRLRLWCLASPRLGAGLILEHRHASAIGTAENLSRGRPGERQDEEPPEEHGYPREPPRTLWHAPPHSAKGFHRPASLCPHATLLSLSNGITWGTAYTTGGVS